MYVGFLGVIVFYSYEKNMMYYYYFFCGDIYCEKVCYVDMIFYKWKLILL